MYTTTHVLLLLAALSSAAAPAHSNARDRDEVAPVAPVDNVLAIVNGTPITTADTKFASKGVGSHQGQAIPTDSKAILDNIITEELMYQKAMQLGIDADPAYQEELRRVETEVLAFKRKKLSEVFLRESAGTADISDAQARAYFTANSAQFSEIYTLSQILRRDAEQIKQDFKALQGGEPFEKVAARQYKDLPPSMSPWELGGMRLMQLPAQWHDVVNGLKKGQHSGIIHGANNRHWIIKLIDKHEDKSISYESVKPMIIEIMKNEKARTQRAAALRELHDKALIVYTKPAEEIRAAASPSKQ